MKQTAKTSSQGPLEANVTALSHDGRGIAHINGKTTFLHGGLPGETVQFTYLNRHGKYDEGKVVAVITAAAERVEPPCAHFGTCGGCSLQHLAHAQQVAHKERVLLEQLQHIGGTVPAQILPPLTGPTQGYRNKARLGVRYVYKKEKLLVGFRELNGRYLADIEQCQVLNPTIGLRLKDLQQLIAGLSIYAHIPQVEIAISDDTCALIFRHLQAFTSEDLEKLRAFGKAQHFYIYLQPGGRASVSLLWPEQDTQLLSYTLPDQQLTLEFHPSDFTQVNAAINQQMVTQAIALLQPQATDRILDLFCGLGNFTLALAQQSTYALGVEGEQALVAQAQTNAKRNNIDNVEFCVGDLSKNALTAPLAQQKFDKILLDPPRCGAREIIQQFAQFAAKKILYVSCNPATLARDTAELTGQGFKLAKAGVMDMFPHTSHVEAMALFEK